MGHMRKLFTKSFFKFLVGFSVLIIIGFGGALFVTIYDERVNSNIASPSSQEGE